MKHFKHLFLPILIIIISVAVGYKLRISRFNEVPFPGESLDEYSNAWVGLSLIRLGMPVGMSGLPGYPTYDSRYINVDRVYQGTAKGNTMQINYPWFDHPPMMGLMTGGFAYLKGARVFEDTSAAIVRKPVIFLSTISIALGAILAWIVFGKEAAIATAVITATSPLMILNSRSVQAENGYLPLFLISMIFLWVYKKQNKQYLLILSAVATGIALLFKLSAGAVLIGGLSVLLMDNKKSISTRLQECLIFGMISASILGLFFVYGLALDIKVFANVFLGNSNRAYGIGFNAIADLITTTKATGGKSIADGWPLVGWLGLIYLVGKKFKSQLFVWVPLLSYLAIYLFFGSESFAWYRIPFMPFLMIISGWLASLYWNNLRLTPISILSLLIPLGINIDKYREVNSMSWLVPGWRMLTLVLIAGSMLLSIKKIKSNKAVKVLVTVVIILLSAAAVYTNLLRAEMFTLDYWYHAA